MHRENWFVAARSDQLHDKKPLVRKILGKPYVFYRDAKRVAHALEDRCPHKNVSFATGKISGDEIVCPYHGWKFAPSGDCTEQPCRGPQEKLRACRIPKFPTLEQDDWIWIYLGDATTPPPPPRYPKEPGVWWFELQNTMKAPADLILENGLDCSHTGIVHAGLFRSAPKDFVTAKIKSDANGVTVRTEGETGGDAIDSRLLVGRSAVFHQDTYIKPHTVRIDYVWGDKRAKFITILICIPEDDVTTRVYTRLGFSIPPVTPLLLPGLYALTSRVVAQDKVILESQAERIAMFGGREFRSVAADTPSNWMLGSYRDALKRGAQDDSATPSAASAKQREHEVTYKL